MKRTVKLLVISVSACALAAGCQATRKVGEVAVAMPFLVAEGLIDGLFESEDRVVDLDRRERRNREWKQHWQDHPEVNPAMHDAFKDDYN